VKILRLKSGALHASLSAKIRIGRGTQPEPIRIWRALTTWVVEPKVLVAVPCLSCARARHEERRKGRPKGG